MSASNAYYSFLNHCQAKLPGFNVYDADNVPENLTTQYLMFSSGSERYNGRGFNQFVQAFVVVPRVDTEPPRLTLDKALEAVLNATLDQGPMTLMDAFSSPTRQIGYYYANLKGKSQTSFEDECVSCVLTWEIDGIDTR